jgi:hypothetical protein
MCRTWAVNLAAVNPPRAGARASAAARAARIQRLVQVDPGDPAGSSLGGKRQLIEDAVGQEAGVGAVAYVLVARSLAVARR